MTKKALSDKAETTVRLWEVDVLRGIAILLMVLYHFVFLLNVMQIAPLEYLSLPWLFVARVASTTFLILVGVSLVLSFQRARLKNQTPSALGTFKSTWQRKTALRGLQILGWGMVISVSTIFAVPQFPVFFGVLHLIGVSILLSVGIVDKPRVALGLAALSFLSAPFVWEQGVAYSHLIWLGKTPLNFQSADYWPVIPWIGLIWIGIFLGNNLFVQYVRQYALPFSQTRVTSALEWCGRHSLRIYLLHMPVIIFLLWIVKVIG